MDLTPDQAASAVEQFNCPTCGVPAGSACRTRSGNTAIKYHTPRFLFVPSLRDAHELDVPDDRGPGRRWQAGPAIPTPAPHGIGKAVRIGYACCSAASPDLHRQLGELQAAQCQYVFSEQVSTGVKARPELDKALTLATDIAKTTPGPPVILTVHELKRLARNTAELFSVSIALLAADIRLELLTGPLAGVYDPAGPGSLFFDVLTAAAHLDHDYVREKTREGQRAAAAKGHHSGRPKVFDEDMLALARTLHEQGMSVPDIAQQLTIKSGKNAGRHPSIASVYRALAQPHPRTAQDSPKPERCTSVR